MTRRYVTGCEAVHPDRRGGQHVAMSCSGVLAIDEDAQLGVLVMDERSQIKNKQKADTLLDWMIELGADDTRHSSSLAEMKGLEGELEAARRELERWRHDVEIEGDYVCENALALIEARAECERMRAVYEASLEWRTAIDGVQAEPTYRHICQRDAALARLRLAIDHAIAATKNEER